MSRAGHIVWNNVKQPMVVCAGNWKGHPPSYISCIANLQEQPCHLTTSAAVLTTVDPDTRSAGRIIYSYEMQIPDRLPDSEHQWQQPHADIRLADSTSGIVLGIQHTCLG